MGFWHIHMGIEGGGRNTDTEPGRFEYTIPKGIMDYTIDKSLMDFTLPKSQDDRTVQPQ